jgi:hypothetical protein
VLVVSTRFYLTWVLLDVVGCDYVQQPFAGIARTGRPANGSSSPHQSVSRGFRSAASPLRISISIWPYNAGTFSFRHQRFPFSQQCGLILSRFSALPISGGQLRASGNLRSLDELIEVLPVKKQPSPEPDEWNFPFPG